MDVKTLVLMLSTGVLSFLSGALIMSGIKGLEIEEYKKELLRMHMLNDIETSALKAYIERDEKQTNEETEE